ELESGFNISKISERVDALDTFGALNEIWTSVRASNKYINENKVWELKDEKLGNAIYNLLESLRLISILLSPFMPETAEKIQGQLGTGKQMLSECRFSEFRGTVKKGGHLFEKVKV